MQLLEQDYNQEMLEREKLTQQEADKAPLLRGRNKLKCHPYLRSEGFLSSRL